MHKNLTEELSIEDYKLDLENRIRNLLWTVSGDYTLDVKPDVSLFLRSREIALYDGIKQGAFARYFDKNLLGLYLVKKIYLDASETELTGLTQLGSRGADLRGTSGGAPHAEKSTGRYPESGIRSTSIL